MERGVVVGTLVVALFLVSIDAKGQCICLHRNRYQYTCSSLGCQKTIYVYECTGLHDSCTACIPGYLFLPCCNIQVGTAGFGGICAPAPEGASLTPPDTSSSRVYVPTCAGGFVAARTRSSP
jgi:hypothetical protein